MKKVNIVRLTKDEKREIERTYATSYAKMSDDEKRNARTFEEFIEQNDNQTLLIMRIAKMRKEWKDAEEMISYVDLIKKVEGCKADTIIMEDAEVKAVVLIMESVISKLQGIDVEQYVQVLKTFKNAEDYKIEQVLKEA